MNIATLGNRVYYALWLVGGGCGVPNVAGDEYVFPALFPGCHIHKNNIPSIKYLTI